MINEYVLEVLRWAAENLSNDDKRVAQQLFEEENITYFNHTETFRFIEDKMKERKYNEQGLLH